VNPVVQDPTEVSASRSTMFPFLDLHAQFATIRSEVTLAVEMVLESQQFILGPDVQKLERDIAELLGCRYAFGCASGSDALLLSLMALGIGVGDEVITTPFTFVATAGSIARLGARPVFVDIDQDTYNLNPDQIGPAITARTKAIIPVHLFGLVARMDEINAIAQTNGLAVIEDAAQAIGAHYQGSFAGNIGDLGCFSFFPSKNLGGAGDGGMVTTNDAGLADRLKLQRLHGSRSKYHYEILGLNSRLDTLQAAVLRVKFRHLHEWTIARRRNASRYRSLFAKAELYKSIQLPIEPLQTHHVYNQFVIRTQERDLLRDYLHRAGIPTEVYYPVPLHLQPAFRYLGYQAGDLPHAESASRSVLALPIFPELTDAQQQSVVACIADFFRANHYQIETNHRREE
jgi:dTDP-4-amino-4,6-dideoxygalactose transaminase